MTSVDDISSMFHDESEKLENLINNVTTKSELSYMKLLRPIFKS